MKDVLRLIAGAPRRRLPHRRRPGDAPAALVGRHPHRPRQRPGVRERRSCLRDASVGRTVRGHRETGHWRTAKAGSTPRLPHEAPPPNDPPRPPDNHPRAHARRPVAGRHRPGPPPPQRAPPQAADHLLPRCPFARSERQAATVDTDGGSFHQDKLEDARKTAIWRAVGWDVRRLPTDVVYDDPNRLIRAARLDS